MGGQIHPPFPCVSNEATIRVSRWQRVYKRGTMPASCVSSTGMPALNAANILKPLVPNAHSTIFTHVADWVAPFPCIRHSPPTPHKLFYIPPSSPPSFFPLCARELGAIIIIIISFLEKKNEKKIWGWKTKDAVWEQFLQGLNRFTILEDDENSLEDNMQNLL